MALYEVAQSAYDGHAMAAYGFRATFLTLANESGLWNPFVIERALAHVDGNKIGDVPSRGVAVGGQRVFR